MLIVDIMRTRTKESSSAIGGALIELTIGLPLSILLISGVLLFGRLLIQLPWAIRSGYESIQIGADYPADLAEFKMNDRVSLFRNILGQDLSSFSTTSTYDAAPTGRTVGMALQGTTSPLLQISQLAGFHFGLVGPLMVRAVAGGSDLSRFENPFGSQYQCENSQQGFECISVAPPEEYQQGQHGPGKLQSEQYNGGCREGTMWCNG